MFLPSKRILDSLGYQLESKIIQREYKKPLNINHNSRVEVDRVLEELQVKNFEKEEYCEGVRLVMTETLENSRIHGPRDGRFGLITILAEKGIINGIWDEGTFLKDSKVKEQLETKEELREEQMDKHDTNGARMGTMLVYTLSEIIEVDIQRGILWTVHYLPKFKPKN